MTDHHASDDARSSAEAFLDELRAFADSEAESLEALAAELTMIRRTFTPPAFDREAIWARIGSRLQRPPEPPAD
jgi:hypothetical protein